MTKRIQICMGSSCFARGNNKNLDVILNFLKEKNLDAKLEIEGLRCCNKCSDGPIITIDGVEYKNVDTGTLIDILERTFKE